MVHAYLDKYSQKWRHVQTSQINVSLAPCHIIRLMSTWWTCHCNLQSDQRSSYVMPYHFMHYLHQAFLHKTICKKLQNIHTHWHLYIKINREFRTKGRCDMDNHACKMHDVEKFWEVYRSICTAKNDFWTISIKFLTIKEENSFTMPYHFTHDVYQACQL